MAYTARTLIGDVLQDIGVIGVGDYLSDEDAQYVLRLLNEWIDALALEPLTVYYVLPSTRTLAANVASFTIGSGGTLNIVRPDRIIGAGLIINSSAPTPVAEPIAVFTQQQWQGIPMKTLTSPLVQGVYYDRNDVGGLATLFLYPVPSIGTTQLVLYTEQALTGFADLDTTYTFPPGYKRFLRTNLRAEIASGFGKTLKPWQEKQASSSRASVKRSNIRPVELRLPVGTPGTDLGNHYDYRTDEAI